MKVTIVELVVWLFSVNFFVVVAEESRWTLVDDHYGKNLHESVCYLRCLSNALNKLYSEGERRLFVNEEVYANASRILDDMEGKTGESTTYLSVVSSEMGGENNKLEKLISYGNAMGDLVAKVGGLFAEVNESVRAVREEIPSALIRANKYYTAIAEITRTVWDDVNRPLQQDKATCGDQKVTGVGELKTECGAHTCPLSDGVNESALQKYKGGCLEINVMSGSVSECFNLPRNKLYRSVALSSSHGFLKWYQDEAKRFQLGLRVKNIFGPLIASFGVGQPPSVLAEMINNITSLQSRFNEVHSNFTSILLADNLTADVDNTDSTI
uniref:VSG expression site-associated protein 117A n=2 Tax=Trypanosoma brucei brucei TaxID=5702 RepID=ESG1_TRYBB|nr:RecName: Full=VSG expression site-associated protein 117A; AltName: Full=ESAG protein; Flags: Precursor [Trypanosoma brucei brucei]AAA30190.1 expression site associated protein (ESAG) [Trypanosoma brucei]CAQ57318.1 expression site-associated gene 1 (ESAG1) protein [Trypanosoma brucei brucei]CAQ57330.1 expression site-associated gene 1 (ESAG1) protein [Trypanosoma brucei brucei]